MSPPTIEDWLHKAWISHYKRMMIYIKDELGVYLNYIKKGPPEPQIIEQIDKVIADIEQVQKSLKQLKRKP